MPQPVVVFPWLAFGHIIPFLELSEQLAKRGHFVTFVSAPRNLARLRPVVPEVRPRIRLAPLLLPRVEGLPDGAESTANVPPEKVELLKVAFDGLAAPFAAFLAGACAAGEAGEGHGRKPDRIVLDFAQHWLPPIADEHGLRATLCTARPRASLPPPPSVSLLRATSTAAPPSTVLSIQLWQTTPGRSASRRGRRPRPSRGRAARASRGCPTPHRMADEATRRRRLGARPRSVGGGRGLRGGPLALLASGRFSAAHLVCSFANDPSAAASIDHPAHSSDERSSFVFPRIHASVSPVLASILERRLHKDRESGKVGRSIVRIHGVTDDAAAAFVRLLDAGRFIW